MVDMILIIIILLVGAVAVCALIAASDKALTRSLAEDTPLRSPALPGRKKAEQEERPLENISEDLLQHLHWILSSTPPEERRHSRWVMSGHWYSDVIQITDAQGRPLWEPSRLDEPDFLMGLPMDIRDGEGPPHLEVYEGPVERPPVKPPEYDQYVPGVGLVHSDSPDNLSRAAKVAEEQSSRLRFAGESMSMTNVEMQGWEELNIYMRSLDTQLMTVMRRIRELGKMPVGHKEAQLAGMKRREAILRAERKIVWLHMQALTDRMAESLVPAGVITTSERRSKDEIKKIRDMTIRKFAEYKKAGYLGKTMVLPEGAEYHPIPGTEDDTYKNTMDDMDHQLMLHGQIPPSKVTGHNADERESYRYALIERKIREHDNVCRQDLPTDEKDEKRKRIRQELEELTNHPGDAITYAITYPGK